MSVFCSIRHIFFFPLSLLENVWWQHWRVEEESGCFHVIWLPFFFTKSLANHSIYSNCGKVYSHMYIQDSGKNTRYFYVTKIISFLLSTNAMMGFFKIQKQAKAWHNLHAIFRICILKHIHIACCIQVFGGGSESGKLSASTEALVHTQSWTTGWLLPLKLLSSLLGAVQCRDQGRITSGGSEARLELWIAWLLATLLLLDSSSLLLFGA